MTLIKFQLPTEGRALALPFMLHLLYWHVLPLISNYRLLCAVMSDDSSCNNSEKIVHGYLHGTLAWLTDGEKMRICQTIKSSKEGNWLLQSIESRKRAQSSLIYTFAI